jgi:hypothetical protein
VDCGENATSTAFNEMEALVHSEETWIVQMNLFGPLSSVGLTDPSMFSTLLRAQATDKSLPARSDE